MTCRELIAFLDDYFAGELAESVRTEFDRHLGLCRECREYLRTYEATVKLVRETAEDAADAPAEVPDGILNAIRAAQQSRL